MTNSNTKQIKIAKRYASALSGLNERTVVFNDLLLTQKVLDESVDLKNFLESPIFSTADKKEILSKVFTNLSDKTMNFLYLLVDKNRFSFFDAILQEFRGELDLISNIKRVDVVSAVELNSDEMYRLKDVLQRKLSANVEITYSIDESIVAGLIIKIGDKVIDNSLKTRLATMKKQLI
ncbi:ATP synthase F1 subunit delta [bacterium]|nr:ATP synthase F1 subunit delta [bacterium]